VEFLQSLHVDVGSFISAVLIFVENCNCYWQPFFVGWGEGHLFLDTM